MGSKHYVTSPNGFVSEKSKYPSAFVSKSKFCAEPSLFIVNTSLIAAIVSDTPESTPTSVSPTVSVAVL